MAGGRVAPTILGWPRPSRDARPYLETGLKGRPETGRMLREIHFRVPGLSPQVSGTGYQVQVRVRGKVQVLNLYPNLNT